MRGEIMTPWFLLWTTGLVDDGVSLGVQENSLSGREMMVPFRSWV